MAVDLSRLAYCGLWCPACSFQAVAETGEMKHIENLPRRYDHLKEKPVEQMACGGCKTETSNCGSHCRMQTCAPERGLQSCAECGEFPCAEMAAFGSDGAPHHAEALANLRRIREAGAEAWFEEYRDQLACPACGARQSWYWQCDCGGKRHEA